MAEKAHLFQTGNSGRKVGSKNKATQTMKEFLTAFTENKQGEIEQAFSRLDDKDKISAWIAMVKFVLPPKVTMQIEPPSVDKSLDGLTYEQIIAIEESNKKLIENFRASNG